MRPSKKGLAFWSFISVISLYLLFSGLTLPFHKTEKPEKPYISPTDPITPDMMKKDFEFVVQKLRDVHPMTIGGFTETQERIISDVRKEIGQQMTKEKFFFLMNDLFHSFHDAHTTQWLVFSSGIDLPLVWLQDGLYIKHDTDLLKQGDKILNIGGQSVSQLFEKLTRIVWTENDHLIGLEGAWMLTARPYLQHMGLVESERVKVTFSRTGREYTIELPFIHLDRPKKENRPFFTWTIDRESNLAVLTLDSCRYDMEYFSKLYQFFCDVHTQKIGNIALDLRLNDGGDSRVIDLFLTYLDVSRIRTYGSLVRYSPESKALLKERDSGVEEFPRSEKENKKIGKKELIFGGKLFVLTSPNTFSSANMFAATLQDNHIGIIVGEPTGNQPSCFGHPLNFESPCTGIDFKISHKKFFRPDPDKDHLDAVYPDVEVYRKIEDITCNKDTQMERIRALIRHGGQA